MPDLMQSLQGRDIGYLRIVARSWGIELTSSNAVSITKELARSILDPLIVIDALASLPPDAHDTLNALIHEGGRLPWAAFSRQFGVIRQAGPGQRDREKIYLHPISSAELLFYRAFIAKAFFDLPAGAQEFAYIPSDLLLLIDQPGKQVEMKKNLMPGYIVKQIGPLGRPASSKECGHPHPSSDHLLDDATTILAALRMDIRSPETSIPVQVVKEFLSAARIIVEGKPQIEPVRIFLEASRKEALENLVKAWMESESFNELHQIPDFSCEGDWSNQPLVTREFLLTLLKAIPENLWWSLPSFFLAVKEKFPDFQRPAGDYDSWFIKRKSDGTYLRGFDTWDEIDGALIRYIITGPLFWLGQVELATPAGIKFISAFRRVNLQSRKPLSDLPKLNVSSQGRITIPRKLSRAIRYQIARFCEWDKEKPDEYDYHITAESLRAAKKQGLTVSQLLSLLARNAAAEIPPSFIKGLKRWELNGTEARLTAMTVLQVSRPEVLVELRKSKASRFLAEPLGPVTVVVKHGAQPKVLAALAEMGLLAEDTALFSTGNGELKPDVK